MNHNCFNHQKREGIFQKTGQGDGEPYPRHENERCGKIILTLGMDDERRSSGKLWQPVEIPSEMMTECASQSPILLENSQTQIP